MTLQARIKASIARLYANGRISDTALNKAQTLRLVTGQERAKIAKSKPKGNPKP
jgi:hypothetical protein